MIRFSVSCEMSWMWMWWCVVFGVLSEFYEFWLDWRWNLIGWWRSAQSCTWGVVAICVCMRCRYWLLWKFVLLLKCSQRTCAYDASCHCSHHHPQRPQHRTLTTTPPHFCGYTLEQHRTQMIDIIQQHNEKTMKQPKTTLSTPKQPKTQDTNFLYSHHHQQQLLPDFYRLPNYNHAKISGTHTPT